jgi:hypothetical protein
MEWMWKEADEAKFMVFIWQMSAVIEGNQEMPQTR